MMPDPTTLTDAIVRHHMAEYPVDTSRHFIPGALLEPRYLQLVKWVPDTGTVLDAGCNSGAAGMRLKVDHPGIELYGCEPNEKLAVLASQTGAFVGIATCMIEDLERLYRPQPYDCIIAMDPLDYAIDADACMAAMMRLLKPGGLFICEGVHEAGSWGNFQRHTDLTRNWTVARALEFGRRYLEHVEAVEVYQRAQTAHPEWVYWRGTKR